jgi:purine-binding chemotaxis protein CheW
MVQLFIFSAGGLRCAIPLAGIQSVIQMMEVVPSTGSVTGKTGDINLHGRIIPVFSMRRFLGAPELPPRLSDMLVVVRVKDETIALWIDDTRGVEDLEVPPAGCPENPDERSVPQGILLTETGTIIIMDLPGFFARGPVPPGLLHAAADTGSTNLPGDDGMEKGQVRTVLAERAAKMIRPDPQTSPAEMTEILRFQLAYREYAVEMKYVREVILTGEITPVPGTPDFISGICAARGQIISLVDLRALLRIPEKGLTDLNRVIVMTDGNITFGILADTISGVGTIALDHIVPPRQDEFPECPRYFKGTLGGNMFLLDAAAILGDPGIIIDDT